MSKPLNQKDLIRKVNWDVLIVLDACRYDIFEAEYEEYLDGHLQKAISPGSRTVEWLKAIFEGGDFGNIVYVSSNPYINSSGIKVSKSFDYDNFFCKIANSILKTSTGFNGAHHFYKVIDVWDEYWGEDLNTVPPEATRKTSQLARKRYPKKRLISHFIQPHGPYLYGPYRSLRVKADKDEEQNLIERIFWTLGIGALRKVLGGVRVREVMNHMNLRLSSIKKTAQEYGREIVRNAYKRNLTRVLKEVRKMTERISGKIIVTSDHGEFLGERGVWWHHPFSKDPILREVPWLEVK